MTGGESSAPPRGATGEDAETAGADRPDETGPIVTDLSSPDMVAHITAYAPPDYRVLSLSEEPLIQIASPPGTDRSVLLALMTNDRQLALYREPLTPSGRSEGSSAIEPLALNVQVDEVRTIALDGRSDRSSGFHATLRSADRAEELFVITTETGSYSVRLPYSSVSRTVLRDLDDDGLEELVQYSRIFEAGGKREIIIDSFRWDGQGFVHSRSLPLLRRVNERLARLQAEIEAADPASSGLDGALMAEPGGPHVSDVLPAEAAWVPELSELSVDLGRPAWELEHDIAIYHGSDIPAIFRIRIVIRANPFATQPVAVLGLDEGVTSK